MKMMTVFQCLSILRRNLHEQTPLSKGGKTYRLIREGALITVELCSAEQANSGNKNVSCESSSKIPIQWLIKKATRQAAVPGDLMAWCLKAAAVTDTWLTLTQNVQCLSTV